MIIVDAIENNRLDLFPNQLSVKLLIKMLYINSYIYQNAQ